MLTCKVGNTIINCVDGTYGKHKLKLWSEESRLICPDCGKPYEYCHGDVVLPYFRHKEKSKCCDEIYHESETEEHIKGKTALYKWLLSIKEQCNLENIKLESYIQETRQKPDVYFEQNGNRYVIEYQCTPIATEYFKRRELYKLAGITDIWILGTDKYYTGRGKTIEKDGNIHFDSRNSIVKLNNIYQFISEDFKILGLSDDIKLDCFIFNNGILSFSENFMDALNTRYKKYSVELIKIQKLKDNMFNNKEVIFNKIRDELYRINPHITNPKISFQINDYSEIRFFGLIVIDFKIKNTKNTMRSFVLDYNHIISYHKKSITTPIYKRTRNYKKVLSYREYSYEYELLERMKLTDKRLIIDTSRFINDSIKEMIEAWLLKKGVK